MTEVKNEKIDLADNEFLDSDCLGGQHINLYE